MQKVLGIQAGTRGQRWDGRGRPLRGVPPRYRGPCQAQEGCPAAAVVVGASGGGVGVGSTLPLAAVRALALAQQRLQALPAAA